MLSQKSIKNQSISSFSLKNMGKLLIDFFNSKNLRNKTESIKKINIKKVLQTEEALKESQQKYQELVENINDAVYQLDTKGRFVYVSPVIKKITGYEPNDIFGKSIFNFIYSEDLPSAKNKFRGVLGGEFYPFETRIVKKDGEIAYVRSFGRLLEKNGKIKGITSVLTDISEQKKTELDLQEREEEYRKIYENAPFGIFHTTLEGKVLKVNPTFARMLKYDSPEEMKKEINKTNVAEKVYANPGLRSNMLKKVKETKSWFTYESQFRCKDGQLLTMLNTIRMIKNKFTGEEELEGFLYDVTEQKKAERNLVESYKYLGTINRQVSVLLNLNKITKEKNKKDVVNLILLSAMEISDSKFSALYKYEKNKNFFLLVSARSSFKISEEKKSKISHLSIQTMECAERIKQNEIEKIGKIEECFKQTKLKEFKEEFNLNFFFAFPIKNKHELEGMLLLGFDNKEKMSDQEKNFCDIFIKYASFVLFDNQRS